MAFSETTSESWGSRIAQSIKAVVVGFGLFILAFPLLFWNEGRAVSTAKGLEEGASAVVSVPADKVNPANEGKLVHVSGTTQTSDVLVDPDFKVSAAGVKLYREVQMYQWKEKTEKKERKKLGGGKETTTTYDYEKTWASSAIDSSRFREDGHDNPSRMPFESQSWQASSVTLGAFSLSPRQVGMISGGQSLQLEQPQVEGLPKRLYASTSGDRRELYLGRNPERPAIGDLRITFRVVPVGPVSTVGAQAGSTFAPYRVSNGSEILLLETGTFNAAQMFQQAQSANTVVTWVLRVIGFLMMLFGLAVAFKPISVLGDVVPFLGDLLGAGTVLFSLLASAGLATLTISVAWIFYRPLLGVGLLLVAGGAIFGLVKLSRSRKQNAEPAFKMPKAALGK